MAATPISEGWSDRIRDLASMGVALDVACPFLKTATVRGIFPSLDGLPRRVLTRLSMFDMLSGVQDLEAIAYLVSKGVDVRGVSKLHAKVFIAPGHAALVGSANLTRAAHNENHEFGALIEDRKFVAQTERWFAELWQIAEPPLTNSRVSELRDELAELRAAYIPAALPGGASDHGVKIKRTQGIAKRSEDGMEQREYPMSEMFSTDAPQYLLKLLGTGAERRSTDESVYELIKESGAHWSLHMGQQPLMVQDGGLAFIGFLTQRDNGRNDVRVFGRGIVDAYRPGRDYASDGDIALRAWKEHWPYYVRVNASQFLDGRLGDGVSIYELMDDEGGWIWETMLERLQVGEEVNPPDALKNRSLVRLSAFGYQRLNERFDAAADRVKLIDSTRMAALDWPEWAEMPA